jgi:hypothetical protein
MYLLLSLWLPNMSCIKRDYGLPHNES